MEIDVGHDVGASYAGNVLDLGGRPGIVRILRAALDFGAGSFTATMPFGVDDGGDWFDVPTGKTAEVPGAFDQQLRSAFAEILLEALDDEHGTVLVLGSEYVEARTPPDAGAAAPTRIVQAPVEGGFETHMLVPGPQDDPESLGLVIAAALGMHRAVGAVARLGGAEVPAHGSIVDDELMRALLADVRMTFMRMTSYDGFLIWRRDARRTT